MPNLKVGLMRFSNIVRKVLVGAVFAFVPAASFAGVFLSVGIAPPALPVYVQPVCPSPGYLWTPGYWAYGPEGYYWVPGVWVAPPSAGLLWTPAYWGWSGGAYLFHAGYWGPHVGFYGGINYGFGYTGVGFVGGRWNGGVFAYNTAVLNVNAAIIHNTYVDRTVIVHNAVYNHASFNGGVGGVQARASAQEMAFSRENHIDATAAQQQHFAAARADRSNLSKVNGGHPQNAAFSRPGVRADNQQARGAQGVRPGGETRSQDNRGASVHNEAATDHAANGGHPAAQDHQQGNQHNANSQAHPQGAAHEGGHEPRK